MIDRIHWLGTSAFLIEGSTARIYFDPYKIKEGLAAADIILISHEHFDHCSAADIKKIYKSDTIIVGPAAVARKLSYPVKVIKPKEALRIKDITIEAVYAYNPHKPFHLKSDSNLGYVVEVDNTRIYHAGDTDFIPDMESIKADIALLPIGGTFTMNAKEAAKAANTIKPKFAIPMHWGGGVGSKKDAEEFKKLCSVEVKIMEQE